MRKLIILILLSSLFEVAFANSRYALVIGNSDYSFAPLTNPRNDAADIADALKNYGFNVNLVTNINQNEFARVLDLFQQDLKNSKNIGVIYYAGHGVQIDSENYLLPISASINSVDSLIRSSISLNKIVNLLDRANNKTNLLILDSCRNNPFNSKSGAVASRSVKLKGKLKDGLAPLMLNVSSGTVIWYATRPGNVAFDGTGRNSPFTNYLLKAMNEHSVPARGIISKVALNMKKSNINQLPWQEGIWLEDFYFAQKGQQPVSKGSEYNNEMLELYQEYLRNCEQRKYDCKHIETAKRKLKAAKEEISANKKDNIQNESNSNLSMTEKVNNPGELGTWQCTFQDSFYHNIKGTTIVEFTKFENGVYFGTSENDFCPGKTKFKINASKDIFKWSVNQPAPCTKTYFTGEYTTTPLGQTIFKGVYTYFTSKGSGGGENICVKIY